MLTVLCSAWYSIKDSLKALTHFPSCVLFIRFMPQKHIIPIHVKIHINLDRAHAKVQAVGVLGLPAKDGCDQFASKVPKRQQFWLFLSFSQSNAGNNSHNFWAPSRPHWAGLAGMFLTLNSLGMVLFTQAVPTCPKTKPRSYFHCDTSKRDVKIASWYKVGNNSWIHSFGLAW